ncbi:hypothetical protein [Methylomicrobium sp. Wu6]|uniref:hypothetical protein n=1 Tax=Methylomicrobium sp. Wu6 TaxID=3107928 RepID=UPI002DD67D0D|nr:hypothetical protein [Methylomicrobium sp. Wu6]
MVDKLKGTKDVVYFSANCLTKPLNIERALADDLETGELQRSFQIEARACPVAVSD